MSRHQNGNGSNDNGPGPMPPRWLECPRKSNDLIVNKFLAFKTPLASKFSDQVPIQNSFPPSMLFSSLKSYNVKIGLWIDLTNTDRFYNKEEVEQHECRYVKLQCKGHAEAPTQDSVDRFSRIVSSFISRNPLEIIAIHCTHGFNRTGFMICSYLVQQMDYGLDLAVDLFKKCRPPGIYKQDYLNELYKRFADGDDIPVAPELPAWHTECDDSGASAAGESSNTGGRKRGGREKNRENPTFMDGVSKVYPITDPARLSKIRSKIQQLCQFKSKNGGFPGCQPVSMSLENINMLKADQYYVSWKADGTRYMMLIDGKSEVYFSDRDNSIFHSPDVEFKDKNDLQINLKNTLLDGEMVIDVDPTTKQKYPRYLIYDAVCINGKDVRQDNFRLRWDRIMHDVIKPRNHAILTRIIDKGREPFSVRRKDFWEATAASTAKLLSPGFTKQLAHEPDGLIFQPDSLEYVCGRCDNVLKWKPHTMNSVDFKMKIVNRGGEGMLTEKICDLYVGGLQQPFGFMKYTKSLKDYNNKIVECSTGPRGEWVFMRERTDKSFPNSFTTAEAVVETIQNPVTEQFLLDFLHKSGFRKPDSVLMPPPPGSVGGAPGPPSGASGASGATQGPPPGNNASHPPSSQRNNNNHHNQNNNPGASSSRSHNNNNVHNSSSSNNSNDSRYPQNTNGTNNNSSDESQRRNKRPSFGGMDILGSLSDSDSDPDEPPPPPPQQKRRKM